MFIGRKDDGTIYGMWTCRQWANQEELPDNDPAVVAFLAPRAPIDQSDLNNIEKRDKAILLCIAQVGGLTVAQIRAMFKAKYDSLP